MVFGFWNVVVGFGFFSFWGRVLWKKVGGACFYYIVFEVLLGLKFFSGRFIFGYSIC